MILQALHASGVLVFQPIFVLVITYDNNWVSLLMRGVLGIGIGMLSVVGPIYIFEMAGKEKRTRYLVSFQLCISFGIFVAFLFGFFVAFYVYTANNKTLSMGLLYGVGGFFGFLQALLSIILPETNYWLQMDSQRKRDLERPLFTPRGSSTPAPQNPYVLLFRYAKSNLALGAVLAIATQLTGASALFYYIFIYYGIPMYYSFGVSGWNLLTALIPLVLVNYAQRRTLILIGLLIVTVANFSHGAVSLAFPVEDSNVISKAIPEMLLVGLFILGLQIGPGGFFWVTITESYPVKVRDQAVGLVNAFQWACSLGLTLSFYSIGENHDKYWSTIFFVFGFFGLVSLVYCFRYFSEEGQKPLIDIDNRRDLMISNNAFSQDVFEIK